MFRYRYDTETGLYYLNSRYYNPEWGRFINADAITGVAGDLLSHNMFAYCKNNPVNLHDPNGYFGWIAAGAIVEAVYGGVSQIVSNAVCGKSGWDLLSGVAGATAGGAVNGALLASGASMIGAGFLGGGC